MSEIVEDVVVFEVRLRANEDGSRLTEAELQQFRTALDNACADVLGSRGMDQHSDKFEVLVRDVAVETTELFGGAPRPRPEGDGP